MNAEIKEYFHLLKEVCRAEYPSLGIAYRQLRGLLEHLCRTQMTDSSLQMTDLSARINFVFSKLGLTVTEQTACILSGLLLMQSSIIGQSLLGTNCCVMPRLYLSL